MALRTKIGKMLMIMHHIAPCTPMHYTIMPFAHVWLIYLICHVYAEQKLEVSTKQV
jgi:hypothetical protein